MVYAVAAVAVVGTAEVVGALTIVGSAPAGCLALFELSKVRTVEVQTASAKFGEGGAIGMVMLTAGEGAEESSVWESEVGIGESWEGPA